MLNVKNRATSSLASGISDSDLSLTVATGEGSRFPVSNFNITIEDEILLCSSRTDDVFTVVREQEDTIASAHDTGKSVQLRITAGIIVELQDRVHNGLGSMDGGTAGEYYHLTSAQHTIATQAATTSVNGYLLTADWNTFNNKSDLALGETETTAYRGDRGKTAYDYSQVGHLPLAGGEIVGNIAFDTTARTIAGIANGDLLDKSADETITGEHTFERIGAYLSSNHFWNTPFMTPLLNNLWFKADERMTVSQTGFSTFDSSYLFENNPGTHDDCQIAIDGTGVLTIDTSPEWSNWGMLYPAGYIYLTFYSTQAPLSITGRFYDYYGDWNTMTDAKNMGGGSYNVWRITVPSDIRAVTYELTINAKDDILTDLIQVEYYAPRPEAAQEFPVVTKYGDNSLFGDLTMTGLSGNAGYYVKVDSSGKLYTEAS